MVLLVHLVSVNQINIQIRQDIYEIKLSHSKLRIMQHTISIVLIIALIALTNDILHHHTLIHIDANLTLTMLIHARVAVESPPAENATTRSYLIASGVTMEKAIALIPPTSE